MSLRGKAAVVGVAESDLGEVGPNFTPLDLIGQATFRALKDAGLDMSDVDGLFSASAYYHMPTLSVGEYLGIRPRYSDATSMGGSSFVSHLLLRRRRDRLRTLRGRPHYLRLDAALGGGRLVTGSEADPYEAPYDPDSVSMYALAASRHMHEYGTTRGQLAEVAVAAREWAKLNPKAFMRDDLSVEDVLASRMVSSPLSVRDCCLVTDGGGAAMQLARREGQGSQRDPRLPAGCWRGPLAPQHKPDAGPYGLGRSRVGAKGLRDGRFGTGRRRRGDALRRFHHKYRAVPGGSRILRKGGGWGLRLGG